jgi:hypothetical protein
MMGELYGRAAYVGQVDLAVVATKLQGAISNSLYKEQVYFETPPRIGQADYRKTTRANASLMASDPKSLAQTLVKQLTDAATQGRYDPFA